MMQLNAQLQQQAGAAVANINQCRGCTSDDALLAAFFAPPSYGRFHVPALTDLKLQQLRDRCTPRCAAGCFAWCV